MTDLDLEELKFCHKCRQTKPKSSFYRSSTTADGVQTQCKSCQVAAKALWKSKQDSSPGLKEMRLAKQRDRARQRSRKEGVYATGITEKRCYTCQEVKSVAEFHGSAKTSDGYRHDCRDCSQDYRKRRARNSHDSYLRSNYRLTVAQYDEIRFRQNYRCAKCFKHENAIPTRLHVDHDHHTLVVRGLLCFDCNVSIGKLGDNAEGLYQAACYLLLAEGIDEVSGRLFDQAARHYFGSRAMYFFPEPGEKSCRDGSVVPTPSAREEVAMSQPPLPGMPMPPRQPFRRPPPTSTVRYSRITSKRYRDLCADCCQAIHELGQEFAPLPKRATWRRSDLFSAVLLCQQHRDERIASESG